MSELESKHIIFIIIGIIIVLYFLYWLTKQSDVSGMSNTSNVSNTSSNNQSNTKPTINLASDDKETPFTLYNFYSPTCGFCKKFTPAWNQVAEKMKGIKSIDVRSVDATLPENENLAFYYNISAYPTIILKTPDRNIEYGGDRSASDLYGFVTKYMNQYYSAKN